MEYPVALAESVTVLPRGPGWWYEPKYDGHRLVMHRTAETTRCHTRSGCTVTSAWLDLAVAGQAVLRPGTVLDGEAVVWVNGQLSFSAAQARGNSTARRSAALTAEYPANFVVWDCLQVDGVELRRRPYTERRAALLEVLDGVPPPIQATPASDDPDVALAWYEHLPAQGCLRTTAVSHTSCWSDASNAFLWVFWAVSRPYGRWAWSWRSTPVRVGSPGGCREC
ncbi:hypothetical protein [Streptomyces alboniger]|uniref:ATP-dependent DNA ligase n=1 Tax=Streptomyces alboniger TaxID=132473 RepID=UPI000AA21B51